MSDNPHTRRTKQRHEHDLIAHRDKGRKGIDKMMKTALLSTKWKRRAILSVTAILLALGIRGATAWAVTSPESTTVGIIEYLPGMLLVQDVAGNNFGAWLVTPNGTDSMGHSVDCSGYNQTIDTLKEWLSMSQAALLSGKNVTIYSATCGTNIVVLTGIDLDK
jgi:hypothetical protein